MAQTSIYNMKKICIIFLGKFAFDARCINMAEAILEKKDVKLSIINLSDKKDIWPQFAKLFGGKYDIK